MTRRQLLRQIAVLLGGTISRPVFVAALDESRQISRAEGWRPHTLSLDQDRLVTTIAELILPATDTPGATDAQVNRFIDLLLTDWFDDDDRARFLTGLADLETGSRAEFGRSFLELSVAEQVSLLEPLDVAGVEARIEAARDVGSFEAENLSFFAMMKEMTLIGYYTSEIGLRQELGYYGFTGTYSGCIPLQEIG
jgi:hypothetical protein